MAIHPKPMPTKIASLTENSRYEMRGRRPLYPLTPPPYWCDPARPIPSRRVGVCRPGSANGAHVDLFDGLEVLDVVGVCRIASAVAADQLLFTVEICESHERHLCAAMANRVDVLGALPHYTPHNWSRS